VIFILNRLYLEKRAIDGQYIRTEQIGTSRNAQTGNTLFQTIYILDTMKLSTLLSCALASLTVAQTPAPYTDPKSGITFNTLQHSSGLFFGIALPLNDSASTDFIATIGGQGTGWSGVSLGGGMLNKLMIVAWPNAQSVVSSFRKVSYV
jgi:hypothetical protein